MFPMSGSRLVVLTVATELAAGRAGAGLQDSASALALLALAQQYQVAALKASSC